MRITHAIGCGLMLALAGAAHADTPIFADSVAEFSAAQGQASWQYGFYNGNGEAPWTPADFEAFPSYDVGAGPVWYRTLGPGGYWTAINAIAGHPNSSVATDNRIHEENWAVRRWSSSTSGLARITGSVADVAAQGGDGVTCKVFVGGTQVWTHDLNDGDLEGATFDLSVCLTEGGPVDFVLTPRGTSDLSDGTFFTAVVRGVVAEAPEDQYACDGQPATFGVVVQGPGSYSFQWRHNGVPIEGEQASTMTIDSPAGGDAGSYDCVISDSCGNVTTAAAMLSVCAIDLNCDTFVDFLDYLEYLNRYDTQDPRADLNQDGFIDFVDYLDFMNLYEAGCGGA